MASGEQAVGSLKYRVDAYERDLIRDALKSSRGNMTAATGVRNLTNKAVTSSLGLA